MWCLQGARLSGAHQHVSLCPPFPRLQALAHALSCHIVVYSVGLPVLELGEEHKGEETEVPGKSSSWPLPPRP